jgi:hypothetical protein
MAHDDIPVACSGHKDVATRGSFLHGSDFKTSHGSLESVDGVDLGDDDACTIGPQRLGALGLFEKSTNWISRMKETYSFANIAIASNDSDLSSKHDVGSTLDAVYKGLAASIVVVELGLCHGIVDVDGGDLEPTLAESLVEVMDTGGGFLRDTLDIYP